MENRSRQQHPPKERERFVESGERMLDASSARRMRWTTEMVLRFDVLASVLDILSLPRESVQPLEFIFRKLRSNGYSTLPC